MNTGFEMYAQKFNQDGFLIVPHLFTAEEMGTLRTEITSILAKLREGEIGNAKIVAMLEASGVYVGLAPYSTFIQSLLQDNRLVDILEAIMGPNIEFLSDKIAYKDEHTDHPRWHR